MLMTKMLVWVMLAADLLTVALGFARLSPISSGAISRASGRHQQVEGAVGRTNTAGHHSWEAAEGRGVAHDTLMVMMGSDGGGDNDSSLREATLGSQQDSATIATATAEAAVDDEIFDKDILGDMNFCLRSTDSALSGPSRSKLLNTITNNVFRAIVIGSHSGLKRVTTQFDDYRIKIGQCKGIGGTVCDFSSSGSVATLEEEESATPIPDNQGRVFMENGKEINDSGVILSEREDLTLAQSYIDMLENLVGCGVVGNSVLGSTSAGSSSAGKGNLYDRGFRRLLTLLRDAGCTFRDPATSGGGNYNPPGGNYNPQQQQQWPLPPEDKNICLSVYDMSMGGAGVANTATAATTTIIDDDNDHSDSGRDSVVGSSVTRELNRISNVVSRAMLYGSADEKTMLADSIEGKTTKVSKAYALEADAQEVVYLLALSYMLRYGLGPAQEQISGEYSNTGEFGESVLEGGIGSVVTEHGALRLYDAYSNAFQRVVDTCLQEISQRRMPSSNQGNDDFLLNILQWEQSLRRNLTTDMWAPNPKELSGPWELVDISGMGPLQSVMVQSPSVFFGMQKGVTVNLLDDGGVDINHPSTAGVKWYFKPGPAHLDTCEFTIYSEKDRTVELKYTGFIDRGQRIESRFSQQPIRMTGRVTSSIAGEPQGSCRFVMAKVTSDKS